MPPPTKAAGEADAAGATAAVAADDTDATDADVHGETTEGITGVVDDVVDDAAAADGETFKDVDDAEARADDDDDDDEAGGTKCTFGGNCALMRATL